ncbi:hypothetical protein D6C95_07881 [Aureobasidium pullulans]|nr:hypothetical protein D6C95_07881 [Aureobasidium pullulans]
MPKGRPKSQVAPCRFCSKQFKRQEHLQRHERTHTREKPYPCECGKDYARQDLLVRHQRLDHQSGTPASGSPPTPHENVSPHLAPNALTSCSTNMPSTQPMSESTVSSLSLPSTSQTVHSILDFQSTSGLDFLWDEAATTFDFLPSVFFNTDYPLSDITDRAELHTNPAPVNPAIDAYGTPQITPEIEVQPSRAPGIVSNDNDALLRRALVATSDAASSWLWTITATTHSSLLHTVRCKTHILPKEFRLPSRHALSRYLESYFRAFDYHLPFVHKPTFSTKTAAPELVLSMAAVGALYRFEHPRGYLLYFAAKALVDDQIAQRSDHVVSHLMARSPEDRVARFSMTSPTIYIPKHILQTIQALLVLLTMSSWADSPIVRDSMSMAGKLAMLVREAALSVDDERPDGLAWEAWVRNEERRRTLFVAYVLFNLQSIAFSVPPMVLSHEVVLCLPSTEIEWNAQTAAEWENLRLTNVGAFEERCFQETLSQVLAGKSVYEHKTVSAFGNYVLIHGCYQQIFFERQASGGFLPFHRSTLRPDVVRIFEGALRAWQNSWEATAESTLDPQSPKGPLGFNATALLRLAYIRLNSNLPPFRRFDDIEPSPIINMFANATSQAVERSVSVDRAILQCIHTLSIPVRAGVAYVARTQVDWSIQHALCNLECALLLCNWLESVACAVESSGMATLREDEKELLAALSSLVRETEVMDDLLNIQDGYAVHFRRLAWCTTKLWAEIFSGGYVFEISHLVGTTLSDIADILEQRLLGGQIR